MIDPQIEELQSTIMMMDLNKDEANSKIDNQGSGKSGEVVTDGYLFTPPSDNKICEGREEVEVDKHQKEVQSKRGYYGWIAPTTSREQPTGKYSNLAFNLYGLSDVKELERNHGNSEESEINVPKEDDPMTNESRKEQKGKKWSNVNKMTNQSRKEKTRWSKEEDERLKNALEKYKHYIQKPWELIADDVKTRKPDQCKSRNQKINKAIEKGKMSNEDYSHDDYIKDKTKKEIEIIQNDKKM